MISIKKVKDNITKIILIVLIMGLIGVAVVFFQNSSKKISDLPDKFYTAESIVVLNSVKKSDITENENSDFYENRENVAKYIETLYVSNYVQSEINQKLKADKFDEPLTAHDNISISGNARIFRIRISSSDKSKAVAICNNFSNIFVHETNKILSDNILSVDQYAKEETTLFFLNNDNVGTITLRDIFIVFLFISAGCILSFILLLFDNRLRSNSEIISQNMHLYLGNLKKGKSSYNNVCLEKIELFCMNSDNCEILFTTVSCNDDIAVKTVHNVCSELEFSRIIESPGLKDNSETWRLLSNCGETILFVNCQKDNLRQVEDIISNYYAAKKKKLVLVFLEK